MTTSTHKVEVIKLQEVYPIEGADRIMRVNVFGGYPCVVAKVDAIPGSLWAYIPPDSMVKVSRPEFAFLNVPGNGVREDGTCRIRTRKFRKQDSMGLLIPAPPHAKEGDDVAEFLEVTHYEPVQKGTAFQPPMGKMEKIYRKIFRRSIKFGEKPPDIHVPYYDIEALRRFPKLFEGHDVVVTEKIHGTNVAYCWKPRGILHRILRWNREQNLRMRSRTVWKKPGDGSWYDQAVTPEIKRFLSENPQCVLFGEIYGPSVQAGFDYGVDKPTFIGFDIYDHEYDIWDAYEVYANAASGIPWVPVLYEGKYDFDLIVSLAEGKSTIGGDHVREGVVIRTLEDESPIRQLKCVGLGYYNKEGK